MLLRHLKLDSFFIRVIKKMTKEDRFRIIAKASGKVSPSPIDITYDIDFFVLDELKYAGLKAWGQQLDVNEEFNKVLEAYNFDGYSPSQNVLNYIRHYSLYPELAAMQHCDLNDNVSYIGEYYDGTPTAKYRKAGRYEIEPIAVDKNRREFSAK
jgi:hypothetical protein